MRAEWSHQKHLRRDGFSLVYSELNTPLMELKMKAALLALALSFSFASYAAPAAPNRAPTLSFASQGVAKPSVQAKAPKGHKNKHKAKRGHGKKHHARHK